MSSYLSILSMDDGTLAQAKKRFIAQTMARDLLTKNNLWPENQADQVTIQHHESGEPYLQGAKDQLPWHISISHSGRWIACLITPRDHPSCIDLEDLNLSRNYQGIASHYFSEDECKTVEKLGAMAFYKIWTAKEAIAKLQGKGLGTALAVKMSTADLESQIVRWGEKSYALTHHITDDYIYTIASYA